MTEKDKTGLEKENTMIPEWRKSGHFYYPYGMYLRRAFGEKVWKISIDAHFSCPNIDGTVGRNGCIFCDAVTYSPSRRFGLDTVREQIEDGIRQLRYRHTVRKFIAYFQPSTNTYAPIDRLRQVYREALDHPAVIGLAIGTRPDVLGDDVLDLLAELSQEKWLSLEIGLQSTHNRTLEYLNRGHRVEAFEDAVQRAQKRHLRLAAHLILGLPGENRADVLETAEQVARWNLDAVKLHHLYVVRGTRLAELWEKGEVPLLSCEEYAELAADFLERISPYTVVERISGEMSPEFLLAPEWTTVKHAARNAVDSVFRRRKTCQGFYYQ